MPRLTDGDIDRLLRQLPRSRASTGFAPRVLAAARPGHAPRRPAVAWIAAAAVAVALALAVWLRPPPAAPPADRQQLLAEQQELMRELEQLKAALRQPTGPVVYLGGDERVDLVLDLGQAWQQRPASRTVPAALGPPAGARPVTQPREEGRRR